MSDQTGALLQGILCFRYKQDMWHQICIGLLGHFTKVYS